MFPGLETLVGSLLGGVFRLGQAFLEAREKQRDRDHEHRMLGLEGELAQKAGEQRMQLVGLEGDIKIEANEIEALKEVSLAQAREASKAGGFVAGLSASVRPFSTYLLLGFYMAVKFAGIMYAWETEGALEAILGAYGAADQAMLASVISFWFVDRSLRVGRSRLAP